MPVENLVVHSEKEADRREAEGWERTGEACDYGKGLIEIFMEREMTGLALAKHIVENAGVFTEEQVYALSNAFDALGEN